MTGATPQQRSITITRLLDAPREAVFRAWTDPAHLRWFAGPLSDPADPITVDLRVGGAWTLTLVESETRRYLTGGIYREIVPPERLVFAWGAAGGWPPIEPGNIDDLAVATITFKDVGGKTEMVAELAFPAHLSDERVREWFALGVRQGWDDTIDRLAPSITAAV